MEEKKLYRLETLAREIYDSKNGNRMRDLVKVIAKTYENNPEGLREYFKNSPAMVGGLATSAYHYLTGDVKPIQKHFLGGLGAIINTSEEGLSFRDLQLSFAKLSGNALKASKNYEHALQYSENSGSSLQGSVNFGNSLEKSINSENSLQFSKNSEMSLKKSRNSENSLQYSTNLGYSLNRSINLGDSLNQSINSENSLLDSTRLESGLSKIIPSNKFSILESKRE